MKAKKVLSFLSLKNIVLLFIIFGGIFTLITGTSYAILNGNISSSKVHVIKSGKIMLLLEENFESIDSMISVLDDTSGLLQNTSYEFSIKNVGTDAAKYDVQLINNVPNTYTGNVIDYEYIKVGLEINDKEYGPMSLSDVNNVIDSNIINKNEIINYKLRLWLDSEKEDDIKNMSNYLTFLNIKVVATQSIEDE